ncbi:MAG: hypothetical protein HC845_08480 [Akkermansiaceae bacterium]|nr:hypothetical protein [Akkermansiaceae bacterium]
MNTKALHQAVHSAVLNEWDPIGIRNIPEAQDEYVAYVPRICELLKLPDSRNDVSSYLWWLATEQMGISENRQVTEDFTDRLIQIATTMKETEQ